MSDEIFDPEIHSVNPKTGEPTLNSDGTFRKKRRQGAAAKPRAAKTSPAAKASVLGDQRGRYAKTVGDSLGVVVAGLSMADPVMGYCAGRIAPLWAEGLADLAMDQPRLAAALEKAAPLGAATALAGLAVMTIAQFAHLAGKAPAEVAKMTGGLSRGEVQTILDQRGEALKRTSRNRNETTEMADVAA